MDLRWSDVCLRWATNLALCPVKDIHSLTDGKFFYEFMILFLDRAPNPETTTQTFQEINKFLNNEFPGTSLVHVEDASQGSEDELLKLCTLFMYMGTVEKGHERLISYSSDDAIFTKEIQFRVKCVFKAISEQRSMLSSDVLLEMMMSRVSETTGQLAAPVGRSRLASTQLTRMKKTSPGSPVIFAYSPGSNSPNKELMDSPVTSNQVSSLKSALEERSSIVRELRVELDGERGEKQFAQQELEQANAEKMKLELEIQRMKQEKRDQQNKEDFNSSLNMETELREKYHQVLDEKRRLGQEFGGLQAKLDHISQEKETIERRCEYLDTDLSKTRTEKHSFELTIEDMSSKLNTTESINMDLKKNIDELQGQLNELAMFNQQCSSSSILSGRPSMANVKFMQCDMTNMSMDAADDSLGISGQLSPTHSGIGSSQILGSPGGENMADIVVPELKEKIESLQAEVEAEHEVKQVLQTSLETLKLEHNQTLAKLQETTILAETIQSKLDIEVVKKENLMTCLAQERNLKTAVDSQLEAEVNARNELTSQLEEEKTKSNVLEQSLNQANSKIESTQLELNELSSVRAKLDQEVEGLNRTIKQAEGHSQNLKSTVDQLELDLNHKIEEQKETQTKNVELQENISQLNIEMEGMVAEISGLQSSSVILQESVQEKTDSLAIAQQQRAQVTEEKTMLETQLGELEQMSLSLKSSLETEKSTVAKQSQEILEKDEVIKESESKLHHLAQEKNNLKERFPILENEKQLLVSNFEAEKTLLKESLQEKIDSLEKSQAQCSELTVKTTNLELKLEELEQETSTLKTSIETDFIQHKQVLHDKDEQLAEAETKLIQQVKEKDCFMEQVSALETEKTSIINKHEEERNELQSCVRLIQQEFSEKLEAEESVTQQRLEEANHNVEAEVEARKELELKISEIENNNQALRKSAEDHEKTMVLRTEEIEIITKEKLELESELNIRLTALGRAGDEMGQLRAMVAELESDSAESLAKLESVISEKETQLLTKTTELDTTVSQMLQLSESFKRIEKEVERENEEKKALAETLEQTKLELGQVQMVTSSDKAELEIVLTETKTKLENLSTAKDAVDRELDNLISDLQALTESKSKVDQELKEVNGAMDAYADKLKATRESETNLAEQVTILKNRIEIMVSECEEHTADRDQLQALVDQLKNAAQDQLTEFESEKLESIKLTTELRLELAQSVTDLEEERLKTSEENAVMEEALQKMEDSRQDKEIERSKLQENLEEMGANFDAKTKEIRSLSERNNKLEEQMTVLSAQLNGADTESKHQVEFLQSELSDRDSEKETLKGQVKDLQDTLNIINSKVSALEKERDRDMAENEELKQQIEDNNSEAQKVFDQIGKLQQDKKDLETEKTNLDAKLQSVQEEKEKMEVEVAEVQEKVANHQTILQEKVANHQTVLQEKTEQLKLVSNQVSELEASTKDAEAEVARMRQERETLAEKNTGLEAQLTQENRTKEGLAASLSELITTCNNLKDGAEKERNKLQAAADAKDKLIQDLEEKVKEKECLEQELEQEKLQNKENLDDQKANEQKVSNLGAEVLSLEEKVQQLEKELAKSEIMVTDLQQEVESKGSKEVKEALEDQKKRYEVRVQEIRTEMTKDANIKMKARLGEKLRDKETKIQKLEEEIKGLNVKMDTKVSQLQSLHLEELEVYRNKYQESQQNFIKLTSKYEVAKDLIKNQRHEKENMSAELNETRSRLNNSDAQLVKRELVQVKTENRRLTTQLTHADIQLREHKRRESSGRLSSSTRSSNSSLSSHPGRATRQSTSNLPDEQDSVFKLPTASHTPGRAKAGRTVSETRMGGRRTKPPHGAGNLFSCEEEAGELFSSSYLTDLQDGRCDVTHDDSRMSELARRNTLCLPHLKSSYPVESQFCTDDEITEDAIRHSKVKPSRNTDFPMPFSPSSTHSPVSNLSKQTLNLTLDSPASNTRSRPLPKPVAFTVDAPRPAKMERRLTLNGGKPTKQPCQGEHGALKKECTSHHEFKQESKPLLEESVALSPDYQRLTRKRKSDQTKRPDMDQIKRPYGALPVKLEPEPEKKSDVQLSPDSDTSSLSRDSVRGSKRYKKEAGNISYNKPGPPTPSRNKSLNQTKHDNSLTSLDSALVDATPNISRASTRSGVSAMTPLLDATNTPNTKQNKSKMTPLRFKSIVGSAFKRGKYRLMSQENKSMGGTVKSPLKAKDKKIKRKI